MDAAKPRTKLPAHAASDNSLVAAPHTPKRRLSGPRRRAQIISVAKDILVDEGVNAVTLRTVAARCGFSVAALQHFYPEKANLFDAMIENIIENYRESYFEVANSMSDSKPEDRLRRFLRYLVSEDLKSPRTAGFFYEIWNLAHRNPRVADAMARLYDDHLTHLKQLISEARPDLAEEEAIRRGAVVMAANDGLMMTIGYGKFPPPALATKEGENRIIELMIDIAVRDAS